MKKVWIYCRTTYDDGLTLNNQLQIIENFAKFKGLKIVGFTSDISQITKRPDYLT